MCANPGSGKCEKNARAPLRSGWAAPPHPLRFKVAFCADRDLNVQKKRPKPSEPDMAIHNIELRGEGASKV